MAGPCTLPYPDRFYSAVKFGENPPFEHGAKKLADETRLLLYSLNQQATVGECKEPKPWAWNAVESAKWQSWHQLGKLSAVEAMRLYVRTLEEDEPGWWAIQQKADAAPKPAAAAPGAGDAKPAVSLPKRVPTEAHAPLPASFSKIQSTGMWIAPYVSGKRPPPRYDHSAAVVGGKLYVVGGNCQGRYLSDVSVLDLEASAWLPKSDGAKAPPPSSAPKTPPPPAPGALEPCAGHRIVAWGTSLLLVGGHLKGKSKSGGPGDLTVRALDTKAMIWSALSPKGPAPSARGGHSVVLVGSKLFVFGGEDASRKLLDELWVLDLEDMAWSRPGAKGAAPSARAAHTACAAGGRYMLVFGGGSISNCFNDLHVLDTSAMEWSAGMAEGTPPSPRAGHASAVLGSKWYITGGGDNLHGCTDTVALDLSNLGVGAMTWSAVTDSQGVRSAVSSEGLSIVSLPGPAPGQGALVAFGGYDGRYHNDIHILKDASAGGGGGGGGGRAAAAAAAAAPAAAPKEDEAAKAKAAAETAAQQAEAQAKAQAKAAEEARARAAAAEANAAKEAATQELGLMRKQLSNAQSALAKSEGELAKALAKVQEEQGKAFKLEVEVAEMKQKLEAAAAMEKELEVYRKREKEAAAGGGGIWGFLSGEPGPKK